MQVYVTNLQYLAMTALTNLFKYSEDSKEIFMQKGGIEFLLQKLRSKQEKVLEVALKLL